VDAMVPTKQGVELFGGTLDFKRKLVGVLRDGMVTREWDE
jgi:hypothetical protein